MLQRDMKRASADDILFFTNTFVWTYEPRNPARGLPSAVPMATWPFQDELLGDLVRSLGVRDEWICKSRDMGATWMVLMVYFWSWMFHEGRSFLIISRKEELVDGGDNLDALFPRFDFVLARMPPWMMPNLTRTYMRLTNHDRSNHIHGTSTTADAGRGGRRTSVFADEFAHIADSFEMDRATADVSNQRIMVSTPHGEANCFAEMRHREGLRKHWLHWPLHPIKAQGLYHDSQGLPRSPWYDAECKRRDPRAVAEQLDMDFLGSEFQFFDQKLLSDCQTLCKDPVWEGEVHFDWETMSDFQIERTRRGKLRLWQPLDHRGRLPESRYIVGADPAMGSVDESGRGASNSVASIVDSMTGERVGEYVTHGYPAADFARLCVALCRWLKDPAGDGAFFIWDATGAPGEVFTSTVLDSDYRHIYVRKRNDSLRKKMSYKPGFIITGTSKRAILDKYQSALRSGIFLNYCAEVLQEARAYVNRGATVDHSSALNAEDPGMARANHGDRVIADAMCVVAITDRAGTSGMVSAKQNGDRHNHPCFATRRRDWENKNRKQR